MLPRSIDYSLLGMFWWFSKSKGSFLYGKLNIENEVDFWKELSTEDRVAIDEGLEQWDKDQYVSQGSVRVEFEK